MPKNSPIFEPMIAAIVSPAVLAAIIFLATDRDPNLDGIFITVFATLVISFLHAIFLGLPAIQLLKRFGLIRWWSLIYVGFIVGCIPTAYLLWPHGTDGGFSHWNGVKEVVTIENGIPTVEGWKEYAQTVLLMGGMGAFAALSFWLMQKRLLTQNSTPMSRLAGQ